MTNLAVFTGRFTKDPEKFLAGETKGVNFSLAQNVRKDKSIFFDFVAFKNQAEVVNNYCKKGDLITVVCKIDQDFYETKEGKKQNKLKFIVNEVTLMSKEKSVETKEEEKSDKKSW